MGSPAGCESDFRQSHLNMIEGAGGWRCAWKHYGDAGLAQRCQLLERHNVCGHYFDERSKTMGICTLAVVLLCHYKEAQSALLRIPSLPYGGQSQCSPE